jgi:Tfp pilus assembly protein PilX
MNMTQHGQRRASRQSGMVSILVTMIIMLVISLIVLGFAQISRREQRQSLDRQLSAQAFFAAETAVNDARKAAEPYITAGTPVPEKEVCEPNGVYNTSPTIDATNNVKYTCLLVSTKVRNLTGSVTATGKSINLPIEPTAAASTLRINWKEPTGQVQQSMLTGNCQTSVPADGHFERDTNSGWKCPYGVMRLDIVPTADLARAGTMAAQKTFFLYPTDAGGTGTAPYGGPTGRVAAMRCTATAGCNADITGLTGGPNYAIRMTAIYVDGVFDISARDSVGAALELQNAQLQIDVTGRAQDVLRRIQVRLPLVAATDTPDHALISASSICKRFEITPNSFQIPNDFKLQDEKNPMCRPMSVSPTP